MNMITLLENYLQKTIEPNLFEHCQNTFDFDQLKVYLTLQQDIINKFESYSLSGSCLSVIKEITLRYHEEIYSIEHLYDKFESFVSRTADPELVLDMLIKTAVELISQEAPKWEFIASYLLALKLDQQIKENTKQYHIHDLYSKLEKLTQIGLYGEYLLENYSKEEIQILESYLKPERTQLLTYSGLELLSKRYLIADHQHHVLENVQEMFMIIAMHIGMNEKDRLPFVMDFYDLLSQLKITMATPTLANARKPLHQLSSCFIDTVPDSLTGIYKSVDNFAQISKYGGGMGMYFGKVRAIGSDIRGFSGCAGGVIRWLKLVNDTAVAVDQLGVRQGAAAVYLDAWHKDLPEFLQIRTNNGDDRLKAHDIFPAVCYPDLFWKMAKEDLNQTWYLMCPHEILMQKGYALEDYYGQEWEKRYFDCIHDPKLSKREILLKDLVRLILKSAVETGTPFTFNRDTVNHFNPNAHQGIIYCSNLCTEIAQNMSETQFYEKETIIVNGEPIIVEKSKPGDFVVCNLASLSLGHLNIQDDRELQKTIYTTIRALDNVIDLNFYPIPNAQITNQKYRAIGLGVSGYHHLLAKQHIAFESEDHLTFSDQLFEKINYYAIEASLLLAKEKGAYSLFKGSDWDNGNYFLKRQYTTEKWKLLQSQIHQYGLRNGYLLAIAPTSSTSIISGTTAAVDPIMKRFFLEEKKGSMIARVAPDLTTENFWYYKSAHLIDQEWVIRSAGIRQRHIDQSQSINLYITNEFTLRKLLNLYISAFENGVKTIYYVRSQSLEVEECDSCSA